MLRLAGLVALATLAGCPLDQLHNYDRPAHYEVGLNTRHYSASADPVVARTTSPQPQDNSLHGDATSVAFRFTMKTRSSTYTGVEAEAGSFSHADGSNLAGGYGVFGARSMNRFGSLSAELVGGWRSARESLNAQDHASGVFEPRVRGELFLSPIFTLGAAAGAELGGDGSWMAG